MKTKRKTATGVDLTGLTIEQAQSAIEEDLNGMRFVTLTINQINGLIDAAVAYAIDDIDTKDESRWCRACWTTVKQCRKNGYKCCPQEDKE